jgi:hypothetical protein
MAPFDKTAKIVEDAVARQFRVAAFERLVSLSDAVAVLALFRHLWRMSAVMANCFSLRVPRKRKNNEGVLRESGCGG